MNRKSIAECEALKKAGEELATESEALEFYRRQQMDHRWREIYQFNQRLTDEELRLREEIIRQNQASQNIVPGSPLYDQMIGAGQVDSVIIDQQAVNKRYAAFVEAGAHPVKHLLKTILRQAAYFVGVMLLAAVAWAVLS